MIGFLCKLIKREIVKAKLTHLKLSPCATIRKLAGLSGIIKAIPVSNVFDSWQYPVYVDDALYITQAYKTTPNGTVLVVE